MSVLERLMTLACCGLAALASADAPPLVLQPNRFSYTFAVPPGWAFSFDQARDFGVPLVFFKSGSNFHESNSVMYVNELCQQACTGKLGAELKRVLDAARADSPALVVAEAPSVRTKSGHMATVRVLDGARDSRQKKEALAFIEYSAAVLLLVLSTKDAHDWAADYGAFRKALAGHELFDCQTPGLRVPCGSGER